MDFSAILGSLTGAGLTAYQIANGAPVSVSTTNVAGVPVTTTSAGSIFSGNSGVIIVIAIAAIALLLIIKK